MEALSLEAGELSPQLTLRLTSFTNDVEALTFVHLCLSLSLGVGVQACMLNTTFYQLCQLAKYLYIILQAICM